MSAKLSASKGTQMVVIFNPRPIVKKAVKANNSGAESFPKPHFKFRSICCGLQHKFLRVKSFSNNILAEVISLLRC